jgi:hypothetical protein
MINQSIIYLKNRHDMLMIISKSKNYHQMTNQSIIYLKNRHDMLMIISTGSL